MHDLATKFQLSTDTTIQFLADKLQGRPCSVCGVVEWFVPSEPESRGLGDATTSPSRPQAMFLLSADRANTGYTFISIQCRNCKHTVFFDAVAIQNEVLNGER